mmetsp:Transcript_50408/g.129854  ORF Transcript_50408/g.129854 Transcript_50408/m.129854 type:complete len:91 (-) Transcript_50408:57-329(-)
MWHNRREAAIVVSLIHLRLNYLKWYFSVETAFVFFQFYEEKMEDQEGQLRMCGCVHFISGVSLCARPPCLRFFLFLSSCLTSVLKADNTG